MFFLEGFRRARAEEEKEQTKKITETSFGKKGIESEMDFDEKT